MKALQVYSRELLKPILKNPKCNFLYTISSNLINVVGNKYVDYCKINKITLNKDQNRASVYLITYNSATSFYINNNKEYIIEKINTLFGYNIVSKLYIQEVPTIINNKKNNIKINKNYKIEKPINATLKQALEELGSTIN